MKSSVAANHKNSFFHKLSFLDIYGPITWAVQNILQAKKWIFLVSLKNTVIAEKSIENQCDGDESLDTEI